VRGTRARSPSGGVDFAGDRRMLVAEPWYRSQGKCPLLGHRQSLPGQRRGADGDQPGDLGDGVEAEIEQDPDRVAISNEKTASALKSAHSRSGAARTPPRWLRAGETVRVEIARLGTLANLIV
jgi:hypothetical protein